MPINPQNIIRLAEAIAPVISSRDVTQGLRSTITSMPAKHVELDFSGVEFISRSAAHELVVLKESLSKKYELVFTNTNPTVTAMLRTIAANRIVPAKKKPDFHPQRTDIKTLLDEPEFASI